MEAIRRVANYAKRHLSKKDAVSLDLGCGTGLFAEAVGVRSIIGVDFSSPLLTLAQKRMDTVWEKDVFNLQLSENSVDNIVSLFVMDDYLAAKKRFFFEQVLRFLKPRGHFFFAAYSPNDERMGSMCQVINTKAGLSFEIHLESVSFYKDALHLCRFIIEKVEIFRTSGLYDIGTESISVKREFILIVAQKPQTASDL